MPKLSVLVPVYNVEAWIDKCARSLFEQTIDDVEYIFVDDCTPDRSIEILTATLAEYPRRIPQVKIIRHDKNRGLVASRNTALKAAIGDFVIHCDSDDWVDREMYEVMYQSAISNNADMVYCSHIMEYGDGRQRVVEPNKKITLATEYLNLMIAGNSDAPSPLWSKMYRREIAQDSRVCCPESMVMNEDLLRNALMLPLCKNVFCVDGVFYHYNRNVNNSTCVASDIATIKKNILCARSVADYIESNVPLIDKSAMNYRKSFIMFLFLSSDMGADAYHKLYPEVQSNILSLNVRIDRKILFLVAKFSYPLARFLFLFISKIKLLAKGKSH